MENDVDPDQMTKPADLDLQGFFQKRINPGLAQQGLTHPIEVKYNKGTNVLALICTFNEFFHLHFFIHIFSEVNYHGTKHKQCGLRCAFAVTPENLLFTNMMHRQII